MWHWDQQFTIFSTWDHLHQLWKCMTKHVCNENTENGELWQCHLCHPWRHRMLSLWQLMVFYPSLVMTKLALWQLLVFSVYIYQCIWSTIHLIQNSKIFHERLIKNSMIVFFHFNTFDVPGTFYEIPVFTKSHRSIRYCWWFLQNVWWFIQNHHILSRWVSARQTWLYC